MWLQRKALYTQIGNDQELASLNIPSSTKKKCLQLLGLVTLSLGSGATGFLAFRSLSEKPSSIPYGPQCWLQYTQLYILNADIWRSGKKLPDIYL